MRLALAFLLLADVGRGPRGIDLLSRLDPARDLYRGAGTAEPEGFVLDAGSRLQLPCLPPEEFDLELDVVRLTEKGKLLVGLSSGERTFDVVIDNWHEEQHRAGLSWLDGKHLTEYPARRGSVFENDKLSRLRYRVRKGSLTVDVDGRELLRFEGDFSRTRSDPRYVPPQARAIYLATELSRFRIQRARLRPLSGRTELLAKPDRCPLPFGSARWACGACRRVLVGGDNPVAPRCCDAAMHKC